MEELARMELISVSQQVTQQYIYKASNLISKINCKYHKTQFLKNQK
jgi:hypothetical protein